MSDEIPFGAAVLKGFKEGIAKRPELSVTFMDNRFDAARAVDSARAIVASKQDLFIEYNIQAAANVPISRMMEEARIKVLAIQAPVGKAPLYAVDNRDSGTQSGQVLAETAKARWPGDAPVVVIVGVPEAGPLFAERAAGARESIANVYPGVSFVEFSSKNDAGNTRQLATDTLTRNPGRKVLFWVHVDAMALAALAAVRNAGREADCLISTTGGDQAAFPEIRKKSSYLGTFSFFPELWAEDLLPVAIRMLRGEAVPERIYPKQALFVTAANIDRYYPS
jgi:ribose transport system substrate-binding protein